MRQFADDLQHHIRLENDVLLPQFGVSPGRSVHVVKKYPLNPAHLERICWGCDRYCPAVAMVCGNGSVAMLHPAELFGENWGQNGDATAPLAPVLPAVDKPVA